MDILKMAEAGLRESGEWKEEPAAGATPEAAAPTPEAAPATENVEAAAEPEASAERVVPDDSADGSTSEAAAAPASTDEAKPAAPAAPAVPQEFEVNIGGAIYRTNPQEVAAVLANQAKQLQDFQKQLASVREEADRTKTWAEYQGWKAAGGSGDLAEFAQYKRSQAAAAPRTEDIDTIVDRKLKERLDGQAQQSAAERNRYLEQNFDDWVRGAIGHADALKDDVDHFAPGVIKVAGELLSKRGKGDPMRAADHDIQGALREATDIVAKREEDRFRKRLGTTLEKHKGANGKLPPAPKGAGAAIPQAPDGQKFDPAAAFKAANGDLSKFFRLAGDDATKKNREIANLGRR